MVVLEEDGRPNPRHRVPLEPPWHILILPPIIVLMDMPICPPPVLPLSAAFSSAPHFNQNQRFHLGMSISCRERGWLLVGQSWLGGDEGEDEQGKNPHGATSRLRGLSVGISRSGSWKG